MQRIRPRNRGLSSTLSGIATIAVAALVIVGGTGTTAHAATDALGQSSLVSAMNGKCLDAPAQSPGTRVHMWTCQGSQHAPQRWSYNPATGALRVFDMCLDAGGGRRLDYVVVWACHEQASQRWDIDSGGRFALRDITDPSGQRLCLTIANGVRENGAQLWLNYCHRGENQPFRRDSSGLGGSRVSIRSDLPGTSGVCAEAPWLAPGMQLWLWACQGPTYANQRFVRTEARELRVNGLCVDGGPGQPGGAVTIKACNGSPPQQWNLGATGELRGMNNLCLHVRNETSANGTPLLMQPCTGTLLGQRWSFVDLA